MSTDGAAGFQCNRTHGNAVEHIAIALLLQELHGLSGARAGLTVQNDLL